MKKWILFLIMCSFLVQASIKTVVFISWKLYQREITELYCVNKSKPEMQCNGKCYLAQQMRKVEADYESSKTPFIPKHIKAAEFLLFFQHTAPVTASITELPIVTFKGGFYLPSNTKNCNHSCFHPPQTVSSKLSA